MIKVNNIEFKSVKTEVIKNSYKNTKNNETREGKSLYIKFICDSVSVGIENNYDIEMLSKLKLDVKEDITKYLTDIYYEDDKGWISLITSDYKCYITRLDDNKYNINLSVKDYDYDIEVNEDITGI